MAVEKANGPSVQVERQFGSGPAKRRIASLASHEHAIAAFRNALLQRCASRRVAGPRNRVHSKKHGRPFRPAEPSSRRTPRLKPRGRSSRAKSWVFGERQEISFSAGLRGGAERTQTTCQACSPIERVFGAAKNGHRKSALAARSPGAWPRRAVKPPRRIAARRAIARTFA